MLSIERLTRTEAVGLARMTFPAYRHLLDLEPAPRHLADGDDRHVQPIAVGARAGTSILGLALAEVPVVSGTNPDRATLLSVFVDPASRRRGIGTALVQRIEDEAARRGLTHLDGVYMTGGAFVDAVAALLARRGWSSPVTRTVTMRATLEELQRMPWYGRVRIEGPHLEIFPWTALTGDEKRRLATSHLADPWITEGLEPWRHDHAGYDEVSSVGLRHRGEVVGWVINHRLAEDLVRFSGAFVREDHARRGRIFALYTNSIERLRRTPCREITCITPARYAAHAAFLRDRCAPFAKFFAETRGAEKRLLETTSSCRFTSPASATSDSCA
jgi:GNAT superfamily N-acetyltransferase